MRRDIRDRNEKGKVKFRVIDFELEGSDESVQESLRSIVSALNRPTASAPVRSLPTATTQNRSPHANAAPQGELFAEDEKVAEEAEEASGSEEQQPDSRPPRSNQPRRYYSPNVLTNLNLQAGTISFKDFCAQKSPTEDSKKYLVIMAWLKENLNIQSIGADHIYTCYRTMGWSTPKDIGATLRALKKKAWVVSSKEKAFFEITHIGLNIVNQMPKAP